MKKKNTIRLFDIWSHGTHTLGPGLRYALWTQGCNRQCPGCITPESRPMDGGFEMEVSALAADIIRQKSCNGITISGGEPFLQAAPLATMLSLIMAERPELTVIIYTGYRQEELSALPDSSELLRWTDVLIDGEYVEAMNDGKGIRGSNNQRIIPLTHRLDRFIEQMCQGRRHVELIASKDGQSVTTIGIPTRNIITYNNKQL